MMKITYVFQFSILKMNKIKNFQEIMKIPIYRPIIK